MPRRVRCVWPGVPYHVTQRGVDRRDTFTINDDRTTYLKLLGQNLPDAGVRLLGWCLMSNHVHLIAVPEREDSLAVCMRRVHGRYAQYYNARHGRNGHLWQNRYFACALGHSHLWIALAYVEQNPLWAGLAPRAEEYRWSSAAAHVTGQDETGLLDMTWWREEGQGAQWAQTLALDLPALLTITTQDFLPREIPLGGLERAFAQATVRVLDLAGIDADPAKVGDRGSAGRMLRVFSPAAQKKCLLLTGAVKKSVQELFERYGDRLGGLIGQDLASEEEGHG